MEQSVRVLIADAQVPVRQGLRALLAAWPEIVVAGMAANTAEIVQMVEKCQPDVVILDIPRPLAIERLEVIGAVKSRWPQIRIVVLTMYTIHRADALAAGADAFLVKGCTAEAIREALQPGKAGKRAPPPVGGGRPQVSVD